MRRPGVKFSSGRLGHMWGAVNGVALANPGKICFCLGSDGSEMEGNDAEAARLAVAQNLNVKLVIDDNDGAWLSSSHHRAHSRSAPLSAAATTHADSGSLCGWQ